MEVSESLINKIYSSSYAGLHFAAPISSLRTNEAELVRGVLQIFQGFSSSIFYWSIKEQRYCAKSGIFVAHLSHSSLHAILAQFTYSATCLRVVENVVNKAETYIKSPSPTLRAFTCAVAAWLRRLRNIALKEEVKINSSDGGTVPTLLGLVSSLSSLSTGAEYLLQIVSETIPEACFNLNPPVPAADISVHILNHLYKRLNAVCLVEGGQEDAYKMLLYIFIGSLLPWIQGLDSWLFEGILDDPFEEMFFYANKEIAIDEADFWEKSYLLRPAQYKKLEVGFVDDLLPFADDQKDMTVKRSISVSSKGKELVGKDLQACPLFIKDIAKEIISAGKSLQLIRYSPKTCSSVSVSNDEIGPSTTQLTLSEIFCVSLAALIGQGGHVSEYIWKDDAIVSLFQSSVGNHRLQENGESLPSVTCFDKFLVDTFPWKRENDIDSIQKGGSDSTNVKRTVVPLGSTDEQFLRAPFCPPNPVLTVCQRFLHKNEDCWNALNLSRNFGLPPLNDEGLRNAIFGGNSTPVSFSKGTNYAFGFQFGQSEYLRSQEDNKLLEELFPFPTLLPSFQEDLHVSEILPFQRNSSLLSRVLNWIQSAEPKSTPLPVVIMQQCLIVYVKKQVDKIGSHILSKLLYDWRLMDELGVLRAIYLLGSGDLLQHFLTVTFNKLDKGESWDDDFELNTVLQESIRNSADGILLSAPDALVVSITKNHASSVDEQQNTSVLVSTPRRSQGQNFGIDGLDSLKFTYKVPWPLELIANNEAIKKYNQVMNFLLKVKRAKFVLDKARRWMWKDRGTATLNRKHHWLVEQKLLHFVDAFHQYVMDRVYHSAWRELCEGMEAAGSLDEVIEVHEAYLLSIQRQCFVVPDKLWALIASRINTILGLALDFYSIQQTLSSGGAVSAIKARCEMEVDRIEKQFDDCIAFLLRVLSFKLNVGQFPHLADLVTRINYNYFYMSDSGNLITAPGSSTISSALGKSFSIRTD